MPTALPSAASAEDTATTATDGVEDLTGLLAQLRREAPPVLVPIELGGLLEEVMDRFDRRAAAKSVRLLNAVSRMPVLGEPGALRHLICHLLDNALRYSEPGGTVTVTALRRDSAVDIRVADNGVGMPAGRLAALARATAPLPAPDTEGNVGRGLGLLLCKTLAERMGGAIRLDSRPGHGTTATVSLTAAPVRRASPERTPHLIN